MQVTRLFRSLLTNYSKTKRTELMLQSNKNSLKEDKPEIMILISKQIIPK
jgi:hypothetical protein